MARRDGDIGEERERKGENNPSPWADTCMTSAIVKGVRTHSYLFSTFWIATEL